jgi:carboxymethylenebutenolidase
VPSFWEKVQVGEQSMNLYASIPVGSGPFPAVVIAQHAGGVDKFIQSTADRLAEEGYAAVAPDLFHRVPDDILSKLAPLEKLKQLGDPEIVADINATVDFLRHHPAIDRNRLGITGFCMGGRVVWLAVATNPHFNAAVPYYGGNIMVPWGDSDKSPYDLSSGINCPILFHFGEIDANPSQADMSKLDAELTRLSIRHQFHTYPGADHAFMDHTGGRYRKDADDVSWPRTLEFFATHLQG